MKQNIVGFLQELSLSEVQIDDDFWNKRLETNRKVTIKHLLKKIEKAGSLDNFLKASGKKKGSYRGIFFNDSNVYKWLEAASYTLANNFDRHLDERIEKIVSIISAAQKEDGYLNTYFILAEPDKKWTNLGMMHELYCAGHLFEAAVAHYQATGKESLLMVAYRFAENIDNVFRLSGRKGIPGHEEVELALVKLYRVTKNERYLKLAKYFIDTRGLKDSPFKNEISNINSIAGYNFKVKVENYDSIIISDLYKKLFLNKEGEYDGSYAQDHMPVRKQKKVIGHAVRALYLYSAVADIAMETGDQELIGILEELWSNMTRKRMYITGSIGSGNKNEGFTEDYDLPNENAYAETCASIGNIFWNYRMLRLSGEARYADLIERVLYNGFLASVSLDGKKFFYTNPLESSGDHYRMEWYNVSCCPPNIASLLASIGQYIYSTYKDEIYIHLYISSKAEMHISRSKVKIKQETQYPWDERIIISISLDEEKEFSLFLRIPGWCDNAKIRINDEDISVCDTKVNGYSKLKRTWKNGDVVELALPMEVQRIKAHPSVRANIGKVALQYGPIVYCLEEIDNGPNLHEIVLPHKAESKAEFDDNLLGGVMTISSKAERYNLPRDEELYKANVEPQYRPVTVKFIPYYAWANRTSGEMMVWITER